MAKRISRLFWNQAVQRQWLTLGRSVLRAATKLPKSKAKLPDQRALETKNSRQPMAAGLAGSRRYFLFTPTEGLAPGLHALVVMLHGCQQTAHEFAGSTRMNRLAAQKGFLVLYPEQDLLANGHGCWNWYSKSSGRSSREASSILSAIDHARATNPIDPERIVIVGLSSGASMAALVALSYPTRFAAVVMHSGVDPALAHSTTSALAAMRGSLPVVGTRAATRHLNLPPLLVIQGSDDPIVAKVNGMRAAQTWAAHQGAAANSARIIRRGNRYPVTTMDWNTDQRLAATLNEINGLGHAWSGGAASYAFSDPKGPDASRMAWGFAQRQFADSQKTAV